MMAIPVDSDGVEESGGVDAVDILHLQAGTRHSSARSGRRLEEGELAVEVRSSIPCSLQRRVYSGSSGLTATRPRLGRRFSGKGDELTAQRPGLSS